jgi:hypothetical protein
MQSSVYFSILRFFSDVWRKCSCHGGKLFDARAVGRTWEAICPPSCRNARLEIYYKTSSL